ncbi:MAG: deoxyhypusine synthase [Candidatus Asgardarchaeia archaeon]
MDKMLNRKVLDLDFSSILSVDDVVRQMGGGGGFVAKKLSVGVNILERMVKDGSCKRFLSFPACIVATGLRGVIKELVKRKLFDVVITTCGTLDHDIARVWRDYYHGSFLMDDRELHRKGINRLGNVLVPNESYGIIIEDKLQPMLRDMYEEGFRNLATYEFVWELGKRIRDDSSIIYWATRNKIPIIIPGITDGAVGYQIWLFRQQKRDFFIDVFKDEELLNEIVWDSERTGALMVGGGISKHHVIWWNQFKEGLDYAVYITTAPEWDGSLSGARVREGISWGKVKEDAKYVTIEGDATVILPFMVMALFERMSVK